MATFWLLETLKTGQENGAVSNSYVFRPRRGRKYEITQFCGKKNDAIMTKTITKHQ